MLNLRNVLIAGVVLSIGTTMFVGCSGQNATQPAGGTQASEDWTAGLDEDVVTALSNLSNTDRTAALAQGTCPVTDKLLGSMGKPPKVTVEGQDVFLCCGGCEEELKKEPAKYIAKLKAK